MTRDTRRTADAASTPKHVTRRTVLSSTAAGLAAVGGATATVTGQSDEPADGELNAVSLDLSNLPDLGDGAYYEGWAIFGEEKVSMGVFSRGQEYVFEVDRDLGMADELVLTIEPDDEAGGPPSGIVALAGAVEDGEAELSFPLDLSDAAGSYLLNTPTAPDAAMESGLWFLEPGDGPTPSLDLPELPPGWTYESWVRYRRSAVSLGQFDDPAEPDDSAAYAGDEASPPPFPGGDLLQNAPDGMEFPTDLTEYVSEVVVSVEPDVDGVELATDGPSPITPLTADVPLDGAAHTSYELERHPDGDFDVRIENTPDEGEPVLGVYNETLPELERGEYHAWLSSEGEEWRHEHQIVRGTNRSLSPENGSDYVAITVEPAGFEPPTEPTAVDAPIVQCEVGDAERDPTPFDFSEASGSYILATPTDGGDSNETSGVWFLEPGDGHVASLDLPDLSDVGGWTYEGWAVVDGQPVTTGRFDDPTTADDAAPYSGEMDGPGFPGEDFVENAPEGLEFPTDLADGASKAVVTVEPDLDGTDPTGDGPFQIKPLVADVPADAEGATSYDLEGDADVGPSGTATLYDDVESAHEARADVELTLELSGLPELAQGTYEGWAIFGEEKVSTGTFGATDQYTMALDRDLTEADAVAVTIESDGGAEGGPSGVVILHGVLEGRVTALDCPVAIDGASGSFLLNTPTSPPTMAQSGVWFLEPNPDSDGHVASLDLPEQPDGWTYEGWIVTDGVPISTGRFDDPTTADDSAQYSGAEDGPPFPGEDLITNEPADDLVFPTDLTDGDSSVVVSVEPDVDGADPTGDGPFAFKPLAAEIPADAEGGESNELATNATTLPSGTAIVGDVDGVTVEGQTVTDVNDDGDYRDVTGDGNVGQADVAEFFRSQHHSTWKRPELFDFSGNGAVTHGDVVELFDYVALH